MDEKEFKILAERYSKGQCAEEEGKAFDAFFDSLAAEPGHFDKRSSVEKEEIRASLYSALQKRIRGNKYFYLSRAWVRAAASVVILLAAGLGWYLGVYRPGTRYITYHTGRGERTVVQL